MLKFKICAFRILHAGCHDDGHQSAFAQGIFSVSSSGVEPRARDARPFTEAVGDIALSAVNRNLSCGLGP